MLNSIFSTVTNGFFFFFDSKNARPVAYVATGTPMLENRAASMNATPFRVRNDKRFSQSRCLPEQINTPLIRSKCVY